MDNLVGPILGASIAELITLPICTLKTVHQSNNSKRISESFRLITSRGKILPFFNSSFPAITAQIFTSAYKLAIFNYIRDYYHITYGLQIIMTCILINISCIIFTNPLDYFRIKLQNGHSIIIKDVYRGFSANMGKAIIGGATYLPIREILKQKFPDKSSIMIGATAATISTIIVHPFDFFKTYMIGASNGSKIPFRNPYRGLSLNLLRIVPHFTIMTEISDKTCAFLKAR